MRVGLSEFGYSIGCVVARGRERARARERELVCVCMCAREYVRSGVRGCARSVSTCACVAYVFDTKLFARS